MDLLVRQVRLRRAAERKVSVLKEQLDVKKEVLNNTAQELDALQASIIFADCWCQIKKAANERKGRAV